jgi:hypothetical protein
MAPISSITSNVISALQGVGGVEPVEAPTKQAPAFQETLTTQNRAFALGLGAPRNHGDIEALFAEVATKFGAEATKATDYAEAAEDAKRSTSLRAAAGNLSLFASLDATVQAAEANIAKQEQIIAEKTAQIDAANAQIATLEGQYAEYRSEWNDNAATQLENAGKIFDLGLDLAGAWLAGDTDEVNRLQGLIDGLEAENSSLFNRNLYLDGEMLRISGEIVALGFQVAGLEIERGWAELSKLGSEAEIGIAQGLLDIFGLVLIPFTVDLALRTMGEMGRSSFEVIADQSGLDSAVEDAVNRLSEQADRMGVIEATRKALEQLPADDPATLTRINEVLAGEGLVPVEGADQAPDTAAIFALLTQLRQMLGNDTAPKVEPERDDPVSETLAETLPPGTGDAQKVAAQAAGLGAGLALLRNILGEIASGEASLNTLVPGASGRLTLAI